MMPTSDRLDEELPCIWVLAGVLSYRPCDRSYECEDCELYHALQGGRGGDAGVDREGVHGRSVAGSADLPSADTVNAFLSRLATGCTLHLDRPHSPGHLWLQCAGDDTIRVGLDDHALRVLEPIDEIVLPRAGVWLTHGEPCGWIVRRRLSVPLAAPIAGEVLEVNPRLGTERVGLGANDDWLFTLRPHEHPDQVADLYRGEYTLRWYLGQMQLVKRHLEAVVSVPQVASLGPMMEDGGSPMPDLEQVLGRERFRGLVSEMFRTHI
jgi:glycine cleavage system H protein